MGDGLENWQKVLWGAGLLEFVPHQTQVQRLLVERTFHDGTCAGGVEALA